VHVGKAKKKIRQSVWRILSQTFLVFREGLMVQYGTSSWGGTRKLPKVFTEQGIAML